MLSKAQVARAPHFKDRDGVGLGAIVAMGIGLFSYRSSGIENLFGLFWTEDYNASEWSHGTVGGGGNLMY